MSFLIDGHNLIPKIPGLSLETLDDEEQLIGLLQEYCRAARKNVEVYFDRAPTGQAGSRKYGHVQVHFIRQGKTADQAIEARLHKLGKQARNFIVVSSDRQVQVAAQAVHAQSISAEEFARIVAQTLQKDSGHSAQTDAEPDISAEDLDEWLHIFGE